MTRRTIYGAIAFAEEAGIKLDKSFNITEMVDLSHCGRRSSVLKDIVNPDYAGRLDDCILDIHKRFDDMQRRFDR